MIPFIRSNPIKISQKINYVYEDIHGSIIHKNENPVAMPVLKNKDMDYSYSIGELWEVQSDMEKD